MKNSRLVQVNRLRAELGLAPLKAHQIAHDRSLAEPKGLRLAGLIELCSTHRGTVKRERSRTAEAA